MDRKHEQAFLTDESIDDCYPDTGESGDSYDFEILSVLGIDGALGTRPLRRLLEKPSTLIQLGEHRRVE